MTDFIGRQKELDVLQEAYEGEASAFIPIYGRRRVGKSELIIQFLKGKRGIYFLGKKAPAGLQMREFLEEAGAAIEDPVLGGFAIETWSAVLNAVVARWPASEKLVLVFDEFQWTVESSPELPSILQEKWDRHWSKSGNVLLILCGSYIGFMEREVLGRKSPLFGRRTAQILLRPFNYRDAAHFHSRYSLRDRALTYFICGGVPFYLRFFEEHRSVEANIRKQLLQEYSPLYREGDFLLREELREVESYYAILLAIADGKTSNLAIAQSTGLDPRRLPYYLQQLLELGYLRKRYPLTGKAKVTRHVRYDLDDPLLRFWFRFVFPNTSFLHHMGAERMWNDRIRPHLDAYFGLCFERLCREALPWLYLREDVSSNFEIGEYWSKETQIDIVGLRDDGFTDLCECKWGRVPSRPRLEEELSRKITAFPNQRGATIAGRVFVRKTRASEATRKSPFQWHDLEDLYAEA